MAEISTKPYMLRAIHELSLIHISFPLPDNLKARLGSVLAEVALNRYPVPSYRSLKAKIRQHMGIPEGYDVVLGNGSDELISIIALACACLLYTSRCV